MEKLVLQAESRTATGGASGRRLRRKGLIPANVYGHGQSRNVFINFHDFNMLLHAMHSEHAVVKFEVDGEGFDVLIKDVQRDKVTHDIIHIDFLVVDLDEIVRISVQIEVWGEADGVKNQAGVLELLRRDIQVECKARDIPEALRVDVSAMGIHDVVHISELPEIAGVTYCGDPGTALLTVAPPTVREEEVAPTEEVAEAAEAEEPEVVGAKGAAKEEPEK